MESETLRNYKNLSFFKRVPAVAVPVLWIAVGYVDPGKWAAAIEGGARFGLDLVWLVLIFNFAAILCQYLSARIAVVTGKDLAQICSEEYDDTTCILLGVQAEISLIALDLTMVLGTAYGLNAIFGIDLFNCVFLTGIDAFLFPFLATLFDNQKAKFLSICLASFLLLSYIFSILTSQPESSLFMGSMLAKVNGESAYALMGLLGANLMPHNFYLHSSIVQQDQGPVHVSKEGLCHDHFYATLSIFSCIFLVNYMLMNLAANSFYSSGLVLLTFQDALSLLDQMFRSSRASLVFVLVIFWSSQIFSISWNLGRQVVIHNLFRLEFPCWLHRATIRIIAIIPALYCVWSSGAEGIYQLLIFAQVAVALLLPSSVIPLFRVASSRSIMGAHKISQLVELLTMVSFIGMLGLKIIFISELLFGESDWVSALKWNIASNVPIPFLFLLTTAILSLCLMLWLLATPLKSTSSHGLNWDIKSSVSESSSERGQIETTEPQYLVDKAVEMEEPTPSAARSYGSPSILSLDLNLPETLLDTETDVLTENNPEMSFSSPSADLPATSKTDAEAAVFTGESPDSKTHNTELIDVPEKTLKVEGDMHNEKDDEGDSWEPTKDISETNQSLVEGPGSYRSISGKNDDVGSGTGSLSRLAGLGRAARRQLTVILDEFWGQLFDFHGQATQEAKAKKLDALLGFDPKVDAKSSFKLEGVSKESSGYLPSIGGLSRTANYYSSPMQQIDHIGMGSSPGIQHGSSLMWSSQMQMLDAYVRSSSYSALDSGEKRYYSMHIPASSEGYDQQPATIHGYNPASYLSQIGKEKGSDYLNGQMDSLMRKSTSSSKSSVTNSLSRPMGQKPQNGLRTPPGFHNVPVSRNNSLKSERPLHDLYSPEPAGYTNSTVNEKKFYSMPDISGLYVPQRDSSMSVNSNLMGYRQSVNRPAHDQAFPGTSSWAGTSLGFDELSPSKVRRDVYPSKFASMSGTSSLWSKQPYEQFGVADKSPPRTQETASMVDLEARLLQSFRSCIMKLLKLEGSEWLFRQNDGADEDLIDRVAARERFLYEVETKTLDRRFGSAIKIEDTDFMKLLSIPNCGDGCVWKVDLVISFGVWCIHRILELSLMESRPELWGKYTYVLNRLQGVIDLAFSKPRSATSPCFCLQLPAGSQQRSSPPITNGSLPPTSKLARGKFTTAPMLLDIIKDVEVAISCRKGRTGTAAGDVAFPKGKENLASVLKRYKRRLSNKSGLSQEGGSGSFKGSSVTSQGL